MELYRGFITEAERLDASGRFTADQVADALIALGCHLSEGIHGPGPVGDRLRRLATLFIGDAKQRGAAAPGPAVN
jgi:hypothetical protein